MHNESKTYVLLVSQGSRSFTIQKSLPPREASVLSDAAYTDYQAEDDLMEAEGVRLMVQRKSNSKRKDEPYIVFLKQAMRKKIETAFSGIKALFLRKIHAVTFKGFLIKIILFIFIDTINKLTN